MLNDPQVITIDTVESTLPRTESAGTKSVYRAPDMNLTLTVSHQLVKGRARRMVRLDRRAVVADPLTAVNDYENVGMFLVIDEPEYGFTDLVLEKTLTGFLAWFTSGNIAKVLGSEH